LETFHVENIPEEQPASKPARSGCLGFVIDALETIFLALILFLGINAVSDRVRVENISMQPTLYAGEFVLVNKLAYKFGPPHYGDVIIFPYPRDPQEKYIKRVIGLPGDEVRIGGGKVYVNNQPLNESYLAAPPAYTGTWNVPKDNIFVLGDNRNQSSDSHVWGFVAVDQVVGKALVVYWPLTKIQVLEHPEIVKASP
jgi:signal peptidase I